MRGLNRLSTKRKEGGKQSKTKQNTLGSRKTYNSFSKGVHGQQKVESNKCMMPLSKKLFTPLHKIQVL